MYLFTSNSFPAVISTVVTIVLVGATIGIIYAVAPLQVADNGSCRDIQGVTELQFVSIGDSLTLTWTTPVSSGRCSLTYDISIYINDVLAEEHTVTNTNYVVNSAVNSCSVVRADIKATSDTDQQGSLVSQTFNSDIGEITDVIITDDLATWTGSSLEGCSFLVEINDGSVQDRQDNTYYDISGYSEPCKSYKISVTPIHYNGTTGDTIDELFETELEEVSGFRLTEDEYGNIVAHWTHLSENCKIRVTVGSEDNSYTYPDVPSASQIMVSSDFIYCIANEVTVQFVSDSDKTGKLTELQYERVTAPEPPQDFYIGMRSDQLIITWNYDSAYENCGIELTKNSEPVIFEDIEQKNELIVTDIFEYCVEHKVRISFHNPSGTTGLASTTKTYSRELVKPENFEIQQYIDTVYLSWTNFKLYEDCKVEINANGKSIFLPEQLVDPVEITLSDLALDYCAEYDVDLTITNPLDDETTSNKISSHRYPAAPIISEIIPTSDTITIMWNYDKYDKCAFDVKVDGVSVEPITTDSTTKISTDDLTNCKKHNIQIMVSLQDNTESISSNGMPVRKPLVAPEITDALEGTDKISVAWNYEEYDACDVTVLVNDKEVMKNPEDTTEIPLDKFWHCNENEIRIEVSDESEDGTVSLSSKEYTIKKKLAAPEILTAVEETGKISVSWNYQEYSACDVTVLVNEEEVLRNPEDTTEIPLDKFSYCVKDKIRIAVLDVLEAATEPLTSVEYEFKKELAAPEILNAVEQADKVSVSWNYQKYSACDVTVLVNVEEVLWNPEDTTEIPLDKFSYCVKDKIRIAVLDVLEAATEPLTSVEYEFKKELAAPEILNAVEQADKVSVSWNYQKYSACDVTVLVNVEEVLWNPEDTTEIPLDKFSYCVKDKIRIAVLDVLEAATEPLTSVEYEFKKVFLPIEKLEGSLTDDVVTIWWELDEIEKCDGAFQLSLGCGSESAETVEYSTTCHKFEECRIDLSSVFEMSIEVVSDDKDLSIELGKMVCSYTGDAMGLYLDEISPNHWKCPTSIVPSAREECVSDMRY
ncbi:hypothetical protein QE152_g15916 [Popillia japonica]|uniref:Fibronectin type-III domain-containing protein n=1 Tax=Popillia japonica TaxID=7064 RepID=A0AAW1L458_POPJA